MEKYKIIITGGGTGGHVFPAIAIANALKKLNQQNEILFVGAEGKLEMQKVPEAGYEIIGLPVRGLKRKLTFENIKTLINLISSISKAKKIIKSFKPDVVVGVGGYASAPVLHVASKRKIPIVLQEQNSYPGITNKMFAKSASAICVAYEENYKFFPREKTYLTGNPVREDFLNITVGRDEALQHFGLDKNKKTIFITGGSLGAATLNKAVESSLDKLVNENIQVIWQCGKYYYNSIKERIGSRDDFGVLTDFVDRMDMAYTAADLVISRSGAITVSELSILGKAVIFVPSPNVAEDHQTKNAMALVAKNAALMVKDNEAQEKLMDLAINTIKNDELLNSLKINIKNFAKPEAAKEIAQIVMKVVE